MGRFLGVLLSVLLGLGLGDAAHAANLDRARIDFEEGHKLLEGGQPNAAAVRLQHGLADDPVNAQAHFDLALALLRIGDLTNVEGHLQAAEKAGYDADEVSATLAELLNRQGKYGRVLDEVKEGNRRKDLEARIRTARGYAELNLRQMSDAERAFKQGIVLAQIGLAQTRIVAADFAGAVDLLEKAITVEPKLPDAWILLGRVRDLLNEPAAARRAFDTAVALAPDNIVARLSRATLVIDSDEKQAAADIAVILDNQPDHWRANLLDAIIKARHEKWREAETALMTIPAPEALPQALFMLARVNLAQGQIGQAEANITHFLALVPNDPMGLAIKSDVLMQRGKPSGAIDALKEALVTRPDHPALLALLSDAYAKNHQNKEAAETLDRLAAVAPRDAVTRIQLAVQRIAVGRINDALDDLAIARAAEPLSPKAITVAIEALLVSNRLDQAVETVEELRRKTPGSPVPDTYLGLIAVRRDGVAAARPYFEKALSLQPSFALAAVNLSQTYRAERRFGEARAIFDRFLEQDPKNEAVLMARADLEKADGKPDAMIAWLERARSADPQGKPPRVQLIGVYLARKEAAKAIPPARELEAISPRDPTAISLLAEAQLANNDRQTAIANFDRVIELTAGAPEPLIRLAGILASGGDVQGGYRLIRKALDANPGDVRVHKAILQYSIKSENVGATAAFVRDLQVRRPGDPSLDHLLGELYEADRRFERAAAAYQAGLAKSESAELVQGLARSQSHTTTPEAAIGTLTRWLEKHPDDRESRLLLAGVFENAKQPDQAIAEYERLLATEPQSPVLLNNLAALYSTKGDERAVGTAEQAYKLAPRSQAIADTLGWILVQKGDVDRALPLLRQAAAGATAAAGSRYHLAVALSKSGSRADAVRVLTELLDSNAAFDDLPAAQELREKLGG